MIYNASRVYTFRSGTHPLFFLHKSNCREKRRTMSDESLYPNICIRLDFWNEDTWWSDSREGALQGTRGQFSSLLFLMWREMLWSWRCCSGLFLCASDHPSSFHLLPTLAARKKETRHLQTCICFYDLFNNAQETMSVWRL